MEPDDLPIPLRLALNYADGRSRAGVSALFALDTRLSELVAKATEPLLAQLRLAWWRDELNKPEAARAKGDPVLDALGRHWSGEERALAELVDGWEHLVGEAPLPENALQAFAEGRAGTFGALARLTGEAQAEDAAHDAGTLWAFADLAARVSDEGERTTALELARNAASHPVRLPRTLRPLAVLRGLALRSVGRGGSPLVARRRDVMSALRLGMFGR